MRPLGRLAGLDPPDEDLAPLANALAAHAELVRALLDEDLSAYEPAARFDPRGP